MKYRLYIKGFIIFCLSLCLLCGCSKSASQDKDSAPGDPGSAQPVTVFYAGKSFYYDGHLTYEFPEDAQLLGETNNVGNQDKVNNLDSNEDGYVYKNLSDEFLYFQWKQWDEKLDGQEPYLLLYYKNSEQPDEEIPSFTYSKVTEIYREGEPGVKTSGFVNTEEVPIYSAKDAIKQAAKECTVKYDTATCSLDSDADIWKVSFYRMGTLGGGQDVFLGYDGKTVLIVYGE